MNAAWFQRKGSMKYQHRVMRTRKKGLSQKRKKVKSKVGGKTTSSITIDRRSCFKLKNTKKLNVKVQIFVLEL